MALKCTFTEEFRIYHCSAYNTKHKIIKNRNMHNVSFLNFKPKKKLFIYSKMHLMFFIFKSVPIFGLIFFCKEREAYVLRVLA